MVKIQECSKAKASFKVTERMSYKILRIMRHYLIKGKLIKNIFMN